VRRKAATFFAALFLFACWGEAPAGAVQVGDEVVLMSDDRPGKARRGRPAVAFGKDCFLVIWREGWHGDGGNSRIHAARVGLDGKMLDARAVEIAPCKTGVQVNPRVAFFGDTFLVVWQDLRNGKDHDVLGARISPEGKVLDDKPISIAVAPRTQVMPDVAADDTGFMVWHGFRGEETVPRVFAARVESNGAVGAPAPLTEGSSPRIAWNGKDHLVTCFDARLSGSRLGMYVQYLRVDTAGKQLFRSTYRDNFAYSHSRQISICGVPGKGWVLVCSRGCPDYWGWNGPGAQRLFSITAEGKRAADSPSERYYDPKREPKVLAPANWLDSSIGKKTHRAAGPAGIPEIWPWGKSALAANGGHCVAVWQRYHTGGSTGIDFVNGDIQAGRVDGWKPLDKDGVPVAATAASESSPALAGNGAGKLLCAYEKIVAGTTQICARTIEAR